MSIISKLRGLFRKPVKADEGRKSLVDHFKNLKNAREVMALLKQPIDRGALMKNVFQRTLEDIKVTTLEVTAGKPVFTTGGSVWAFDAATQTPIVRKAVDNEKVSSIDQYKAFSNTSENIPDEIYAFYARGFITWTTCAQFAQHEIINRACAVRGEDAVAVGYEIVYADTDAGVDANNDGKIDKKEREDKDKTKSDFITALEKKTARMGINEVLRKLDYNKCVYGIGVAVPTFEADVDMSTPFNIDAKGLETYTGWTLIEPYWLCPMFNEKDGSDPSSKHFFEPTWWRLPNGKMIHRSWCVKVVNSHVADILKPTYIYGGIPLTQMIYERVFAADKCANEAPMLALTKRLLVVDANIQQVLADPKHVKDLMDVVTYCRTNWGVMFKQPTANINQIDTSLGEYDQLIMTQYQLVASIAQMPATKLLKVTPTGFQSTGEYEWKDWAQSLIDIQEMEFTPLLERHFQLLTKRIGKSVALTVKWNAVDAPTAKEMADIQATKVSSYTQLLSAGAVTIDEVRDVLRNDKDGEFTGLSMESPKKDADLMEQLQKEMGGDKNPINAGADDSAPAQDAAEFKESDHPRDKDGKFVKGAGVGVRHTLLEYKKERGKQLFDKKGNHLYAEARKAKEFVFPKVSQSEKRDTRKVSKSLASHFNGGSTTPDMTQWNANAKAVKFSGKLTIAQMRSTEKMERSNKPRFGYTDEVKVVRDPKTHRKHKVVTRRPVMKKGKPIYDWTFHGQKLSDKEAYNLEHALANGGYGAFLSPQSVSVAVRADYANGRGQIGSYYPKGSGNQQCPLDAKTSRFYKNEHIEQINSLYTNFDKVYDAITADFDKRKDDDFAVLAYFQYRTTCRVGSSSSNQNSGALQLKKEDVVVAGDTIIIDYDAKNGHWHTECKDKALAEWFKYNQKYMKNGEAYFGNTDYGEYCEYLTELGERCGIKKIKRDGHADEGLTSHNMRHMSATMLASRLVDELESQYDDLEGKGERDWNQYIKDIEGVVTKVAKHINDEPVTAFKSYIAPAALWKHMPEIYASNERFVPPTGR